MYNDFEIGSYLIFEGYPRHRVFVDPRLPAYPPEFHQLLGRFDLTRDEWDQAMDRYGVESALLAYAGLNRRVSWWDPARWALVYRQHDARVFVRRLPKWRALIAAREIPATFSFTVEEGTATLPIDEPPPGVTGAGLRVAAAARRSLRRARRGAPRARGRRLSPRAGGARLPGARRRGGAAPVAAARARVGNALRVPGQELKGSGRSPCRAVRPAP